MKQTKSTIQPNTASVDVSGTVTTRALNTSCREAMPPQDTFVSRRSFLLSAAAAAGALRAQDPQDTTFTADVKVVNVFATVRDKQGKIVPDLTKDDFVLDEDGRPQLIRYFARESNLPLTLGLLVDTSGSQRRVLGQERTASYRFLDQVLTDKDQAFVIHFDRDV